MKTPPDPIPPGSVIGILGGGQLGRMLAIAAAQLGYRVHVYAPEASGSATEVAWAWTRGAYEDEAALAAFGRAVDVVTYEFENLPAGPVAALGRLAPVRPGAAALEVAQDRLAEKRFAAALGVPTAPWMQVDDEDGLADAVAQLGSAVLKTRRLGYDGKGQARLSAPAEAERAWAAIGAQPAIVEGLVPFAAEFSILLCRGADGAVAAWEPVENRHEGGILATSTVPAAGIVAAQGPRALEIARALAERLDYVGVLACEFFAGADGPVFNEMAPRVHNSGHWTIEGAVTSQFENHVRAVCGLPLADTARRGARVEMRNLLGEAAAEWPAILADPAAKLHLYGKTDAKPGRKMGHVTRVMG